MTSRRDQAARLWALTDLQPLATTQSSHLYRATMQGAPVVLKLLTPAGEDEAPGGHLLTAWNGQDAVRLIAQAPGAMLLEALDGPTLGEAIRSGHMAERDSHALLAALLARLHRPMPTPPGLAPLDRRFAPLLTAPLADPALGPSADLARQLLSSAQDPRPLHGDFHHDNVMLTPAGWKAIDPKGVFGDPGYDAANLYLNPFGTLHALDPDRITALTAALSRALDQPAPRLLAWAVAHLGLALSWVHQDGGDLAPGLRHLPPLHAAFAAAGGPAAL